MARRLPAGHDRGHHLTVVADDLLDRSASSLAGELDAVRHRWDASSAMTVQTRVRVEETVSRYTAWVDANGLDSFGDVTAQQARAFVLAPTREGTQPVIATRQARRTALRLLYRTLRVLGHHVGDPTLDLHLPPKGARPARPLTDDEVALCRITAGLSHGTRASLRSVMWALGEASAISSEMSVVRLRDLDEPTAPTRVQLPGTYRHAARVGPLTDWGRQILTAHATRLLAAGATPDTRLAYSGDATPGGATAQASACNVIREVLRRTGLDAEQDLRPASLRHWAGKTAYERGASIQDVALLLGTGSLDTAAQNIHLDWRQPHTTGTRNR
ncbi:hypothetical protein [Janibacter sp. DB-40]|uniref:hypothetical protein n=1 Tax=Janibacter sp. DB-40 TaxID=3028808 RepID=UPI002407671B|nr:hypothetical protein [Janibacter sp. DB-40]